MTSPRILFIAGTLAILVHFAFAIRCYNCKSDVNVNCGEPFKSEGVKISDCDEEEPVSNVIGGQNNIVTDIGTACATITTKNQNKTVIMRACFDSELCKVSPEPKQCDLCTDDLCNGGPSSSSSVGLLLMIGATFISIFVK